ncbi:hypothetical protein HPP92_006112 [Vanilla planifolia]|uniref:RING-type domain-containing protein n=1 Tax=Vanilla planifolia TaxID=51239 RepID=A0A835RQY0_VANPL|nr:hypothetical protein HPP92_006112 [Vanilla planifolia]
MSLSGDLPSASSVPFSSSSSSSSSSSLSRSIGNLGLGYATAIALGLLVLLSTLLFASYFFCRAFSRRRRIPTPNATVDASGGAILPRSVFSAEDDAEEGPGFGSSAGLDSSDIASYPKFSFSVAAKAKGKGDGICAVCLCDYREGEMLMMMPDCGHFFHLMCIDAWLRINPSCPVCRNSPMQTPVSTPLSETGVYEWR